MTGGGCHGWRLRLAEALVTIYPGNTALVAKILRAEGARTSIFVFTVDFPLPPLKLSTTNSIGLIWHAVGMKGDVSRFDSSMIHTPVLGLVGLHTKKGSQVGAQDMTEAALTKRERDERRPACGNR